MIVQHMLAVRSQDIQILTKRAYLHVITHQAIFKDIKSTSVESRPVAVC